MGSGWFDAFRENGWNSYYGEQKTGVWGDITQVVIIFCSVVLATSLLVIVIGTRGKERWSTFLKLIFNLHIGVVLLVTLTGQFWQLTTVNTFCDYYVSTDTGLRADIGIRVGLKSINITLDVSSNETTGGQEIHYNEQFSLEYVDDITHGLLEAKRRGLPSGILYVLEYFAFDGGGLRWTRVLRLNGYFVFILLLSALVSWLLACAMLGFVTTRGALLLILTGALMFLSCVTYHANQPLQPLVVPFEDTQMELRYGWCFWVCAISGALTMLAGVGIISVITWCSETTCVKLLGCGRGEDDDDMYDLPPIDEGPLELDTPFQERKKSVKYYQNSAFEMEEGQLKRPWTTKRPATQSQPQTGSRNGGTGSKHLLRQVQSVPVILDSSDDEPPEVPIPDVPSDIPEVASRAAPIYSLLDPGGMTPDSSSFRSRDLSPAGSRRDMERSAGANRYSSSSGHVTGSGTASVPEFSTSTPEVGQDFPESIWREEGGEESPIIFTAGPEVTDEELSRAGWTPDLEGSVAGRHQLSTSGDSGTVTPSSGNCRTVIDLENNHISYNDDT